MKYPVVSDIEEVQAEYLAMRQAGESHAIAEILALRKVPGSNTERELFAGRTLSGQFKGDEGSLSALVQNCRAAGRTVSDADIYEPSLARYPLDPAAVVPHDDGKHYIRKTCESRGWPCEGVVNVKASGPSPLEKTAKRRGK